MTTFADAIIAHALETRWHHLDTPAQGAVKTFLLDTLGVGIAGASAAITRPVRKAARHWGEGRGAHIWGRGGWQTTPATAAFVNGFQIHCQEFDCVHEAAVVHPLATILAAMMAEAESRGDIEGACFGTALAVAVDVAASIGVAVTSPIRFFRPANAGIFGAAVGVALLRGFGEQELRNALGYALSFCSGTMQAHTEGKPALPVQIAAAARGAIMACDLAEAGMDGPHDVFEGPYGYFPLFETEWSLQEVTAALGHRWRIAEVSHKPFPTGRAAQGGIVLMQQLRAQGVTPDALTHIELSAPPLIQRLVGRPWQAGMSANYARLCFAYCGAVALRRGEVSLADFTQEALGDPVTGNLAQRIGVTASTVTDAAAFTPQQATATLKDGRQVTASLDALPGSPADPLSAAQNEAKFRQCLAFGLPEAGDTLADQIIGRVNALERLEDVGVLARLASDKEG